MCWRGMLMKVSKNSLAHCIFALQLKEWEWRSGQGDTAAGS